MSDSHMCRVQRSRLRPEQSAQFPLVYPGCDIEEKSGPRPGRFSDAEPVTEGYLPRAELDPSRLGAYGPDQTDVGL